MRIEAVEVHQVTSEVILAASLKLLGLLVG